MTTGTAATSLAMLLKLTGNETHTAYDGLEAVEAAATFRPDVVLLDIGLPKLNGYEACRRIREQPWGKNIVLVALTGWGQEEDRRKVPKRWLRRSHGQAGRLRRADETACRVTLGVTEIEPRPENPWFYGTRRRKSFRLQIV